MLCMGSIRCRSNFHVLPADSCPCMLLHILCQFSRHSLAAYSAISLFSRAILRTSFLFLRCLFHLRVRECRSTHRLESLASTNGVSTVVLISWVYFLSVFRCRWAHSSYDSFRVSMASFASSSFLSCVCFLAPVRYSGFAENRPVLGSEDADPDYLMVRPEIRVFAFPICFQGPGGPGEVRGGVARYAVACPREDSSFIDEIQLIFPRDLDQCLSSFGGDLVAPCGVKCIKVAHNQERAAIG